MFLGAVGVVLVALACKQNQAAQDADASVGAAVTSATAQPSADEQASDDTPVVTTKPTAAPVKTAKPADDLTPPAWLVLAPGEKVTSRDGKCYVVKRPVPVPDDTARCEPLPAPAGDFISLPDSLDRGCPVGFTQAGAYSCTRACKADGDCKGGKGCDKSNNLCNM